MTKKNLQATTGFACNSVRDYLETYYNGWDTEDDQMMTFLHETFKLIAPCQTLLDVGGGPTIFQHVSARTKVAELTFTDYLEDNLEQINLWLKGDQGAFNWDHYFRYVKKLENSGESIQAMKSTLRSRVKNTRQLNILSEPEPVFGRREFDIVSCYFCLEAATFKFADFQKGLQNIVFYAKPQAQILLCFLENCSNYIVGGKTFDCFPVTKDLLLREMKRMGCTINVLKTGPSAQRDYDSSIYLWAQKN